MKFSSTIITLVFLGSSLFAQDSEQWVKIFISNDLVEYIDSKANELNELHSIVNNAFQEGDDYTIGTKKAEIVRIVHSFPSTFHNLANVIVGVKENPDFQGQRAGLVFEQFAEEARKNGNFVEVKLSQDETILIEQANSIIQSAKSRLKSKEYAIHSSQRTIGSAENVRLLGVYVDHMKQVSEILNTGTHR